MEKNIVDNYKKAFRNFLEMSRKSLKANLKAAVLIGSLAKEDIVPGISDIDVILICEDPRVDTYLNVARIKKSIEESSSIGIGVDLIKEENIKRPKILPGKVTLGLCSINDGYSCLKYGSLPKFNLERYLFSNEFFFQNFKLLYYLECKNLNNLDFNNTGFLRKASIKKLRTSVTLLRLINLKEQKKREFNNTILFKKFSKEPGIKTIKMIYENRSTLITATREKLIKILEACQKFIENLAQKYYLVG